MRQLWPDLRSGVRMLGRYPTLSMAAVLTFGLGIGLSTTVFSVVNGGLFKGLPLPNADRLMALLVSAPARNIDRAPVSVHDLAVWQERQTVFEAFGAFSQSAINLSADDDRPERYSAGLLTVGAFEALATEPILGRGFRRGEDRPGADPVILLSYEVWRDRFRGSPDVLGRTVAANGIKRTIVGVMPERFGFPILERLWIPLEVDPLATARGKGPSYRVIARLEPGVRVAEARAEAAAIFATLAREHAATNDGLEPEVLPYVEMILGTEIHAMLYTMLGAGIGVLLIACVNVSNLLLARASLRQREVAVRLAIGASRARVIAQMLTEVVVLALGGAALGMLLSIAAMQWFVASMQINPPPFWITFELDYRVLLFVAAVTASASLFAGLLPAIQATRTNVAAAVKDDSRGATGFRIGRFSGALVVAEVAVSCALLIASGLMIKSVVQLRNVPMPFAVQDVLTARINLPRTDYPDAASCVRFYEELLPRLQTVPGVEAATLSDGLPAAGNGTLAIQIDGRAYATDRDYPVVREGIVTPGYFETFQTPVRGRAFLPSDRADSLPVAMINESFVRAYFAGGDPLGRRIKRGRADSKEPWLTIVGVVPDLLMQGIGNQNQSPAGYYIPIAQSDVTNFVSIALRSRVDPGTLAVGLRATVAALDDRLAIYDVRSMSDVIRRQTWFYTVFGTFFMAFGCVALLLAVAGLYGVMSFAVTQRTREMGIRAALGARGGQLVRLVMTRALVQLAFGLALGLALGLLAAGPLQPILYEVAPRDPLVLATVPLALAAASLLASFLPARRAAGVDPVIALAAE
jgi:predicted permease